MGRTFKAMLSQDYINLQFKESDMPNMIDYRKEMNERVNKSQIKIQGPNMEKMFDLMIIQLKYNLRNMTQPDELYHVVHTYLSSINDMISSGQENTALMLDRFTEMVKDYTPYDYYIMRQKLFKFAEGATKKSKLLLD